MNRNFRYVPFVQNLKIRTVIGFVILILSVILTGMIFGNRRLGIVILISAFAWMVSVFLTDRYVHKYPQRYFTYLFASHLKSAMLMAFFLFIIGKIAGINKISQDVLWTSFIFSIFTDAVISMFRRRDIPEKKSSAVEPSFGIKFTPDRASGDVIVNPVLSPINKQAVLEQIHPALDRSLVEFIEKNIPDSQEGARDVLIVDDASVTYDQSKFSPVALLIGSTRINDVRRLNQFTLFCANRIIMGGYLVVSYMPLENIAKNLKVCYPGLLRWPVFILHFIWYRALPKIPWLDTLYFSSKVSWLDKFYLLLAKKRNRALSKAEVWGRLSFCGMQVIVESKGDGELYLIAQRVTLLVQNKRPSYYPIVALEKVGLDGKIIRMHKIRTMFPFSEFLQKRIFEDHGLLPTGKFANDFRLTGLGKFLRKYWLDELPQIFDWLQGDVKLVGMRATSRHFLSLYPKELYDLYIQIKPGLIPPIFDESTNGFDQIVKVELKYLESYWKHPVRTDIRYFIKTFTDIVFRGIRSK